MERGHSVGEGRFRAICCCFFFICGKDEYTAQNIARRVAGDSNWK